MTVPNVPFLNASISVGKNGADAGMVKTRGFMSMIGSWHVVIPTQTGIDSHHQSKFGSTCDYRPSRTTLCGL